MPNSERLADEAITVALWRMDAIANINRTLNSSKFPPGFFVRQIAVHEAEIVRIANTLMHR